MKYINLSPGFNPYGAKDEDIIKFESSTFPGGEPHIRILDIDKQTEAQEITITHRLNSFNDLGLLMLARDTCWGQSYNEIHLFIPYMPGARQDRVCNPGEAFTLEVYAELINNMGFESVTVFDAHSDETGNNVSDSILLENHEFVDAAIVDINPSLGYYLVAPDKGASKKIKELADYIGHHKIAQGEKVRDLETTKLTGFAVDAPDFCGMDCVIVDDICDGGGTFIGLAKELKKKNAGDIYLIVSHGIFSKGTEILSDYITRIYTTDSIKERGESVDLKQIKLCIEK